MLKNFIKVAVRSLLRNKYYAFINILGLSVALAASMVAWLNYDFTNSYDAFHENTDEVYRINSTRVANNRSVLYGLTPMGLGPALEQDFPAIERSVRFSRTSVILRYGDKVFDEQVHFADPGFFEMFTFPVAAGDQNPLARKQSIVLTRPVAEKYFGEENPVGKQISIEYGNGFETSLIVAAVMEKITQGSSIQFEFLLPYENLADLGIDDLNSWDRWAFTTFVQISDAAVAASLPSQFQQYIERQNAAMPDFQMTQFSFDPLLNIAESGREMRGNILNDGINPTAIVGPSVTAFLLLLMACFNFMNTSIAFSSRRLKEIGVRKVVGARRQGLIFQFMGENILLCMVSFAIAVPLGYLFADKYNALFPNVELFFDYTSNPELFIVFGALLFGTAIFSGVYPAYYISAYSPVRIMKGEQKVGGTNPLARVLMSLQFSISILAVIMSLIMAQNAEFQRTFDFGYNKENVIVVRVDGESEFEAYRNALQKHPQIEAIAGGGNHVGYSWYRRIAKHFQAEEEIEVMNIGENYLDVMGFNLLSGRAFDSALESDFDRSIIVNQKLVETFGWQEPLKQEIEIDSVKYSVIGVVKDFHNNGLWRLVEPSALRLAKPETYNYLTAVVSTEDLVGANALMEGEWFKLFPNSPYSGSYQDNVLAEAAFVTNSIKTISEYIAIIAILISAMGLFALVSLNIAKRTKEIGIRKVLGASIGQIGGLINKEFALVLLAAAVLATAIGFFTAGALLDGIYAYRVPVTAFPFVVAIVIVFIVSILTISSQVYKITTLNPVNAIRKE